MIIALTFISVVALVVAIYANYRLTIANRKLGSVFDKSNKKDLYSELLQHQARQHELKSLAVGVKDSLDHLKDIQTKAFQKSGLVRFNPFRNTGGNQSFCLCLLDLNDSGVLITVIHGRDGTRIYAKSINKGLSAQELSKEEAKALKSAISNN